MFMEQVLLVNQRGTFMEYILSMHFLAKVNLAFEIMLVVIGLFFYKRLSVPLRWLVWLTVCWLFFSWTEIIIPYVLHRYNLWLYSFITVIEFAFFVHIVRLWLTGEKIRSLPWIVLGFYLFIWIVAKLTFEPLTVADDITGTIANVFKVGVSILLLLQIFSEPEFSWSTDERFWVVSAFILHAVSTILLFSSFTFLLKNAVEVLRHLYNINWIMNSIIYCMFIWAYICNAKKHHVAIEAPKAVNREEEVRVKYP